MRRPLAGQGLCQLGDRGLGRVVGALLLRVQHAGAGDGGEEDDGAAAAGADHVVRARLGDEEGAGQVDVHDVPEAGWRVGFRRDLGAGGSGSPCFLAMWSIRVFVCVCRAIWGFLMGGGEAGRQAYSAIPAELTTMSMAPRSL